ncbi:hypothetical protein [Phycicoccus avicenniae]|uniref:hypothetical protein n=1 Tax=Phycicoccus avicenniae TaxID=2828860 RepID=UPI003D2B8B7A
MSGADRSPALLELRQYLLREDARDTLVRLFDDELVEPQEACGMEVLGQLRDVDHARRFVWLRGFGGPDERTAALTRFYGGPVWQAFRDRANATMVDSDDVLQLRPHPAGPGLVVRPAARRDEPGDPGAVVLVVVHRQRGREREVDALALGALTDLARAAGLSVRAVLETDSSPNGFPALPVRRASCLVWMATGPGPEVLDPVADGLAGVRLLLARRAEELGLDEVQLDVRRCLPTSRSTLVHEGEAQEGTASQTVVSP